MFRPDLGRGVPALLFWADHFDGRARHLAARDVTLAAVSRAPLRKLVVYKRRMGWSFPWVSSYGSDFNYDFGVSFSPEAIADHTAVYNYGSRSRLRGPGGYQHLCPG